jgi:hypothetical protein
MPDKITDTKRINWLAKNEVVQQEVGSNGWRLPELDFRAAIDAVMKAEEKRRKPAASQISGEEPYEIPEEFRR